MYATAAAIPAKKMQSKVKVQGHVIMKRSQLHVASTGSLIASNTSPTALATYDDVYNGWRFHGSVVRCMNEVTLC